jgi:hypothetical protein
MVSVHFWIVAPDAEPEFPGKRPEHAIVAVMPLPSESAVVMTAEQHVMTVGQQRALDDTVLRGAAMVDDAGMWREIDADSRLALSMSDDSTGSASCVELDASRLALVRPHVKPS